MNKFNEENILIMSDVSFLLFFGDAPLGLQNGWLKKK